MVSNSVTNYVVDLEQFLISNYPRISSFRKAKTPWTSAPLAIALRNGSTSQNLVGTL